MLHQKLGIEFLKDHPRCLLADEAGLGKSRQVLEAAKLFVKGRNLLVVCPTSVIENWKDECRKWGFPEEKFVVIGYEYGFLHKFEELRLRRWGVIVFDESHNLRNLTAQKTKNAIKLIKGRDSKIWFLSGTPIVKGAMDLFVTISICEPGVHGKYKDFCEKFCNKKVDQWSPGGFKYEGVKGVRELNAILDRIMLRRYKRDEVDDLPPKIISKVPVTLPQSHFDIFTDSGLIRAVCNAVMSGGGTLDPEYAETLQQLGLKKVDHVVKFCEDTLFPHPLVIFAHHRAVIYDIAEKLRDKGRKVQVIIGSMDKRLKHQYVKDFQNGLLDDLVCGLTVAGVGINLFKSSRCVFAEFPWTYAALDQASDRLHRIGQKDCVNAYWMIAKGTFEESMIKVIESRKDMTEDTVGI